jgi:hypothetical protein
MPVRHRGFRAANGGLSPYMLWLLCGVGLGFRITQDERQKRMYLLQTRTKSSFIHATAVNALVGKKLLRLSDDGTFFILTTDGFVAAHDRLRKTGLTPKAPISKKLERIDCAYSSDGVDSSYYCG